MHNIEHNIITFRRVVAHLRMTRQKEGLERYALENKIKSANDIIKQLNQIIDAKKDELAVILDKKINRAYG